MHSVHGFDRRRKNTNECMLLLVDAVALLLTSSLEGK